MSTPFIKLDKPVSDYSLLCRGCLAESGEMKNMQEWGLAEDFYRMAVVPKREDVTELLCTSCEDSLTRCRAFQQRCQDSDAFLKDTAKKKTNYLNVEQNSVTCILNDNTLTVIITATDMDSKIHLPCPFATSKSCQEKYLKRYLNKHLAKHHGLKNITIDTRYYCTYENCSYYVKNNKKHFTERKYLNQHYNKVHSEKITCEHCGVDVASMEFERHMKDCNIKYVCQMCNVVYKNNERLLVHLMRRHPDLHKEYKEERKSKRKAEPLTECKKIKIEDKDYICDSPKRTLATQTRPEDNIKNDVALPPWKDSEAKTDEISTQTVFEDLLSLKSQTSEDDSIFFSETVSLSDIHTQTFPVEFGLSRKKQTKTCETQSPDLSIKETQTCFCMYEPKLNFKFDSVTSSPSSHLTSTETQTGEFKGDRSEDLLSFHSTETQTCFEEELNNS